LIRRRPVEYGKLLVDWKKNPGPYAAAELTAFGVNHAQASEHLLRRWGFPAESSFAVGRSHDAGVDLSRQRNLLGIVILAERCGDLLLCPSAETLQAFLEDWTLVTGADHLPESSLFDAIQTGTLGLADLLSVEFPDGLPGSKAVETVLDQAIQAESNPAKAPPSANS
jgi:hypothetical protein